MYNMRHECTRANSLCQHISYFCPSVNNPPSDTEALVVRPHPRHDDDCALHIGVLCHEIERCRYRQANHPAPSFSDKVVEEDVRVDTCSDEQAGKSITSATPLAPEHLAYCAAGRDDTILLRCLFLECYTHEGAQRLKPRVHGIVPWFGPDSEVPTLVVTQFVEECFRFTFSMDSHFR